MLTQRKNNVRDKQNESPRQGEGKRKKKKGERLGNMILKIVPCKGKASAKKGEKEKKGRNGGRNRKTYGLFKIADQCGRDKRPTEAGKKTLDTCLPTPGGVNKGKGDGTRGGTEKRRVQHLQWGGAKELEKMGKRRTPRVKEKCTIFVKRDVRCHCSSQTRERPKGGGQGGQETSLLGALASKALGNGQPVFVQTGAGENKWTRAPSCAKVGGVDNRRASRQKQG